MVVFDAFLVTFFSSLAPAAIASMTASSMNMLYSTTRILNLAHGAFLTLGAYINYLLLTYLHIDLTYSIIMVYLVIAFLGLTLVTTLTKVGVLLKTDYEIEEISIIITFALMMLIQGVVSELFGATPKTLSLPITGLSFSVGEKLSITVTEILIVLISLITFFISYTGLFSSHMPIGREVVCYIQDKELSRIVGLNLDKLNVLVGTTSIGIVGVAGALYSLLYPLHPYIGVYYTVISFVAMAVSGVGKLSTSYIIALAIVIAQSLIGSVITYSAATGVVYILLVMLLIIRPRGIVRGLR